MVEDLSNRQAATALTVLTGRFAEILDAVEAGVTVVDADLRVVYANRAAAELCGWSTAEEMLAASKEETLARFELLDAFGAPVSLAVLPGRRVLAGEDPEPVIVRFRVRATGEDRWSIVRARAIELEPGQRFAITTFNDLTAHVREGQASLAVERRYREIVEALPVFAWFADPDGALIATNARWLEYTGMIADSVALENVEQVHPDERADLAARWNAAHLAVEPLEATVRLRRHDGVYGWHIVRVVPLRGEAGTLQGWIGTATDIDEERRASQTLLEGERQFRDLTDNAPMLVWMADAEHGHTFFNRGWLEFTGRTVDDEVGDGWAELVHPADVERRRTTIAQALDRQGRFEIEYRLRRRDGAYRWVLDIGAPRRGADGEFLGLVGSCIDIEERKRAADIARLVADAGLRLDEARDLAGTIQAAASLAIPDLADWCLVDLLEPDGSLRRVAAVASDPDHQAIVDEIRAFPTSRESARPGAQVIQERRPILITDLANPEVVRRYTANNEALGGIIQAMEARSAIVQPLIARGETIGAMFFVVGPNREYGPADIEITTELAGRAALAIANATIHSAEQAARQAAEAAAERIERLQRITRELAAASSRDVVAELVVREGRAAVGASGALIALTQGDTLSIIASHGYDAAVVAAYDETPLASPVPLARAAREGVAVWLPDVTEGDVADERVRQAIKSSPHRSICAVPLVSEGTTFGVLGLSFAEQRSFDADDHALIGAYADLCAQALARVALAAIRERLVADLESQRARLQALLQQLPEGLLIAEAPSGRIVLANDRLEEILRMPASDIHLAGGEAYQGFDTDGRPLLPEDWPLARAVRGETVPYTEIELVRADGTRTWVAKRAGPVFDREGRVVAGVATIIDIAEARRARENRQFLANATELLGSSLDYEDTIRQVAELAVPRIGDWCAVDILDENGTARRIAVAHTDPAKIAFARDIEERYPSDPNSPHGLAFVLRTGQSDMMSDIPAELIEAGATDAEHLALLRALQLRSYMCVPIIAGGQVLGAATFVGAESGRLYGPDDLAFAESLAARAASAVSNARSFREALRYKSVLDATLDTVIMFDPVTLRLSYVNRGAVDQLGYSAKELLAGEATMLIEDLDAIGIRGLVAPLVSGSLDAQTSTLTLRHRDGRTIPVEVLLQHVAPPGEDGRIVAVARDIADRLDSQANLRRLAEAEHAKAAELNAVIRAMGDGIFVCGDDGRISLSNPAAEEVFPDVNEETYADVLAQLEDPDGDAPALGTVGGPVELRVLGGDERWIELSTYPVSRGPEESPERGIETIVMLREVTANRQRQAIRDTFIGVLSHELRTPVTTIFAGSKVLARDDNNLSPETRQEIFSDIVVESERLHRLVEDVIAMTRFGEDEGEVGTEPVLIQRVLPVVIRSEEVRWPGVTFEMDLPAGIPTAVADPTYVEQVVRNLLSNAAKYGGSGTTVRVKVRADESEITVTIGDDGPGFPVDEAERLFELFFRSARTASAAAGAGIGLFVCARLIKAMGGRIWATPRPDRGADFSFTLRIMDEEP